VTISANVGYATRSLEIHAHTLVTLQITRYTCSMQDYITRHMHARLETALRDFPAVALLGPRQCGKTTLARATVGQRPTTVMLDLERPSDLRRLADPELFFRMHRAQRADTLFCLDEIQRVPELFPVLRSVIDETGRPGQFLLLGSASQALLRQTSETLAGRIVFLELTPFLATEVAATPGEVLASLWLRGGFPRSVLARSEATSYQWRESFIRTFLERDLPQLGITIPAATLHRLWGMLAHSHGQLLNSSQLGAALGVSHTTLRAYLELLTQTFMVRLLPPYHANVRKRLVKSPKVYIRDSGLLHALLELADLDALLGHPIVGASWEGFVLEQLLGALPEWQAHFYRTASGAEIDLVLSRGRQRLAVEAKASVAPVVSRGFYTAMADLDIEAGWIIAPVDTPYPLRERVMVAPVSHLVQLMR